VQGPYHVGFDYPNRISAGGAIVRLIDGLGFRFYWGTQGLENEDYAFSPAGGCNSLAWLVSHIWGLVNWVHMSVLGQPAVRPGRPAEQRAHVLELIWTVRNRINAISDTDLATITIESQPFWHLINGPLADAISHVGQITVLRRLMGKPAPEARVFTCEPPADA
jgi:hypothetical protein